MELVSSLLLPTGYWLWKVQGRGTKRFTAGHLLVGFLVGIGKTWRQLVLYMSGSVISPAYTYSLVEFHLR